MPSFMGVLVKHLRSLGIGVPYDATAGTYQRFLGDTSVIGKGEILVWHAHARRQRVTDPAEHFFVSGLPRA